MKKSYVLSLLCFLCCLTLSAQTDLEFKEGNEQVSSILPVTKNKPVLQDSEEGFARCGTMKGLEWRMENDSEYAQFRKDAVNMPSQQLLKAIPCDGTNAIVIPVAFHFDEGFDCNDASCALAEVQDQLDALNIAFGDNTGTAAEADCPQAYQDGAGNSVASTGTCISFCLAVPPTGNAQGLDPTCDPPITFDVFNGGLNGGGNGAPGWGGILNIFITNNQCLGVADGIPGAANGDGVTVCGPAFGGFGPASGGCGSGLDNDGTFNLGATLIHEVGHYLGLYHTFQGGCGSDTPTGTNESNPPGPFDVLDTPAHQNPTGGCPTGCNTSCGGTATGTANFMDYTDDACMSLFTEDQAAVMNYWANQLFGGTTAVCATTTPSADNISCANEPCNLVCPAAVVTPLATTADFCETSGPVTLDETGVVLDDNSDAVFTWSTGGYLSAGGVAVTSPAAAVTATGCTVAIETFYLNIDCGMTPLNPTLDGGTHTVTVYPGPPADLTTLVMITGENTCNEPTVAPMEGCESYVTITPDAGNPTFPVAGGVSGAASYTLTWVSNPLGPECCTIGGMDGVELVLNGDLEAGTANWTELEEVPVGTTNPNPFGVIGVSGETLMVPVMPGLEAGEVL